MRKMSESASSTFYVENDETKKPCYEEIIIKMDTKLNKVSQDIDLLTKTIASMTTNKPEINGSENINEPGLQASSSKPHDQHNTYETSSDLPQPVKADLNVTTVMSRDVSMVNSLATMKDESWWKMLRSKFKRKKKDKSTTDDFVRKYTQSDICAEKISSQENVLIHKKHEMEHNSLTSSRQELNVQKENMLRHGQPTDISLQDQTSTWAKQKREKTSKIWVSENRDYPNSTCLKDEGLEANGEHENITIPKAYGYPAKTIKTEMMLLDNSEEKTVKLILFGCSGYGKTSTINSLMGNHCLNISSKMLMTEQDPVYLCKIVNGERMKYVDTPGMEENNSMSHLETIHKSLALVKHSFSAILLILKYGERFTQQTKSIVKSLKGILGDKVIEDCCVCVMTNGEQFDEDMRQREEPFSFEQWCLEQDPDVGMLFRECKNRCILFENKTSDKGKIKSQLDELISVVKKLKPYTKSDFESITAERDAFWDECLLPEITRETDKKISTLRQKLDTFDTFQSDEDKFIKLNLLLAEIEKIRSFLPLQAKDINSKLDGLTQEIEAKQRLIEQNPHFLENLDIL